MSYKYKRCPFCNIALTKVIQYKSTFVCSNCLSCRDNYMFIQNSSFMEISTKKDDFYFTLNWSGHWYIKNFEGYLFQSGDKKLTAKEAIKMLERYEKLGVFI